MKKTLRFAAVGLVASLSTITAAPVNAHSTAIDTSISCPSSTSTVGFSDLDGLDDATKTAINCLDARGIAQGTSASTFAPNGTVTRWQMALFLVRQAVHHQVSVPASSPQGYTDISGLSQEAQDAINQITQLRISVGTSSTTFSPNEPVSRWQMALFLRRLAALAGVLVTDDPAHNRFTDIGDYTAEIQAAINFLADGHLALGTEGSLFSGNNSVLRWQMALFMTRVLAADVTVSSPALVSVATQASTNIAIGDGRYFIATFTDENGAPYTGAIGILLLPVIGGVVEWDGMPAASATFDSVSDGLVVLGPLAEGFAGPDGVVTFRMRHTGVAAEAVVAVVWQDRNDDNDPEIVGNGPPGEPFATGGVASFVAGILPNCGGPTSGFAPLSAVDTVADRLEVVGICNVYYDSNDLFAIEGVPTTMAAFEAALNLGDEITANLYDDNPFNQSDLNLSIDNPSGTALIASTNASNSTGAFGQLDVDDQILIVFTEDVAGIGPGVTISLLDADGTTTTITCGLEAICTTGPANQLLVTIAGPLTTIGGISPGIENESSVTAVGGITAVDNAAPVNSADASILVRTFGGF